MCPAILHLFTMLLLQEVNLHNNRLTRFRLASSLLQMTSLILSGNELSIAEDFSNLVSGVSSVLNEHFIFVISSLTWSFLI